MNTAIVINLFALVCFIAGVIKDPKKAKMSLKIAFKSFIRILPSVIAIVVLIGLLLGFVSKNVISSIIGEQAGLLGVLITASLGAILFIPSIIAFPLAASLLDSGASVMAVATFITTLTMVGFVTLPLEIQELGKKLALLRNGFSFLIAIAIGLILGMIL